MTNQGEQQWYSLQGGATYLDISEMNVQNLTQKGILAHHVREGRLGVWFKRDDLENVSSRLIRDDDPVV